MSLFKYFKKNAKDGLSDPNGPLSSRVASDAIALANQEVSAWGISAELVTCGGKNVVHTIGK